MAVHPQSYNHNPMEQEIMPLPDDIMIPVQPKKQHEGPLWAGPEVDGVTFSLLSRFLVCRERFRCLVMDGLVPADGFNHKIEYGSMWHKCEEALAKVGYFDHSSNEVIEDIIFPPLMQYAQELCKKYKTQQAEVDKWYNVCKIQFPEYVRYWEAHPDVTNRYPIEQEKAFCVDYRLSQSRRVVKLRGKRDSLDIIDSGNGGEIWLQENKTKGQPKPVQLQRQLTFDLQTMLYLVALHTEAQQLDSPLAEYGEYPIAGVRYNVIKRPLSGGKGNIVQHKPTKSNPQGESREAYFNRLRQYIVDEPNEYFMRWSIAVTAEDVKRFREKCLDPILETLCLWYDVMTGVPISVGPWSLQRMMNWQHPFGVWNPLDEGGGTDLDEYLLTGSTVGLTYTDNLFPELS